MVTTATANFVGTLPALGTSVGSYVALAAVAAVGVGIVVYGIRKVWGAFRGM